MKFEFHGSAYEIGRSCIELDNTYLFDSGIKVGEVAEYPDNIEREPDCKGATCMVELPTRINFHDIKAVFLSHAHMDHCGALPLFDHFGLKCPIFTTRTTKKICQIMFKDAEKLGKMKDPQHATTSENSHAILDAMQLVPKGKEQQFDDLSFEFFHAGHIPGAVATLVKYQGKSIIYSGDISEASQLMTGVEKMPKADVLICEATYGNRCHPPRQESEQRFLEAVQEVLEAGGSVIVPSFALGRAQEIILLLDKGNFNVPIYLDGMARKITQVCLDEPKSIRDGRALQHAMRNVNMVSFKERERAAKKQGIFVTTSGMMSGGPVMSYLKYMHKSNKNAIFLVGYQAHGTNGRRLMNGEELIIDGEHIAWNGTFDHFDFSAHSGQDELIRYIDAINPKHLILNHGDPDAIETLGKLCEKNGRKVYMPHLGETIIIE